MHKWRCLLYNDNLKTLIWSKNWNKPSIFWFEMCLFLWISPLLLIYKEYASHFRREIPNEKEQKHWNLINPWSDKLFKGTVVNQALPSVHAGSLEITLTVTSTIWNHISQQKCVYWPVNEGELAETMFLSSSDSSLNPKSILRSTPTLRQRTSFYVLLVVCLIIWRIIC